MTKTYNTKLIISFAFLLSAFAIVTASILLSVLSLATAASEDDDYIFNSRSELYLVYDFEEIADEELTDFVSAIFEINYMGPRAWSQDKEKMPHEIVIGDVGREISDIAYTHLRQLPAEGEDDVRFLIYSDGTSVAVAYDGDVGNFTRNIAIEYFTDNFITDELVLGEGVAYETVFNLYDCLAERDAEYFEKRWATITEKLGEGGEEIVAALKSYYELYNGEKIITWLTKLYEPSICVCAKLEGKGECLKTKYCGTGGFYYSNSARDNQGFLPDAESCAQALAILGNCGITYGLPGSGYSAVVPDWMAKQICDFIYNLQEPDGFFYHPQWGENITTSRRGRDLSWCTGILKTYNKVKKYTTSSSLPESEYRLETTLGVSSVSAVSKVISTAAVAVAPHLETLEKFAQYLEDLDIYNRSYHAGNTLSAQASQINARGKKYVDLMMDKLNEVYNYYGNGTWHHTVNYYAINGVMKISGRYNGNRVPIPNAALTCRAAFDAIGSDEEVKDVVDIWNPWVAFNACIDNIKACDGKEKAAEITAELYSEYAEAVINTRDKLALFRKEDGSFSYQKNNSSATSQGAPVAVPKTNEGDVNATVIATSNFTSELFQILPVSRVPFCLSKERYVFYKILEDIAPQND